MQGCRGTGKEWRFPARIAWDRARGANSVFFNRSPNRNSQTALTLIPRAASSGVQRQMRRLAEPLHDEPRLIVHGR
jgi:hypothetical protein